MSCLRECPFSGTTLIFEMCAGCSLQFALCRCKGLSFVENMESTLNVFIHFHKRFSDNGASALSGQLNQLVRLLICFAHRTSGLKFRSSPHAQQISEVVSLDG
jgi:hypothetical protein